jgi:Flp pilus assembly protein TadG
MKLQVTNQEKKKSGIEIFPVKRHRGQSLVEFSVSMVILLILFTGAVDFGWAFFTLVSLNDAAQEGAAYAAICPAQTADIRTRVLESAPDLIGRTLLAEDISVCVAGVDNASCGATPQIGGYVKVELDYDHQVITPFIGAIIGTQTIPLRTNAWNRILQTTCQAG